MFKKIWGLLELLLQWKYFNKNEIHDEILGLSTNRPIFFYIHYDQKHLWGNFMKKYFIRDELKQKVLMNCNVSFQIMIWPLTYGSCVHPLRWGSRRPRHSAIWQGGSDHLNTGNSLQDTDPEEERFRAGQLGSPLRQTDPCILASHHTTSFSGYTGTCTYTGTVQHHRSKAVELLVLGWRYM